MFKTLLAAALAFGAAGITYAQTPFYVIGHMTNTTEAVDIALAGGANALELDLQFDDEDPEDFQHGWPCDCSCYTGVAITSGPAGWTGFPLICAALQEGISIPCNGDEDLDVMLRHIAKAYVTRPSFHVVIIDSKVGDLKLTEWTKAGPNVVDALNTHLFGNGYRGEVVIGAPAAVQLPYLDAALRHARTTPWGAHYSVTIDGSQTKDEAIIPLGILGAFPAQERVFGAGISACSPEPISNFTEIAQSVPEDYRLNYTWTIDSERSMQRLIAAGVNGIMTNFPAAAVKLVQSRSDLVLATGRP